MKIKIEYENGNFALFIKFFFLSQRQKEKLFTTKYNKGRCINSFVHMFQHVVINVMKMNKLDARDPAIS